MLYIAPKQVAILSYANFRVYVDDNRVGDLKSGKHSVLWLSSGKHTIRINDRTHTRLTVDVKNSQTTVVRSEVQKEMNVDLAVVSVKLAVRD